MKKLILAVAVVALALGLYSCGGGSDTPPTPTTTALKGLAACAAVAGEGVICGTAVAPDGQTPIVGAEVRLVTSAAQTISLKGLSADSTGKATAGDTCVVDNIGAFACSSPSLIGAFTAQIAGGGFSAFTFTGTGTSGDVTNIPISSTTAPSGSSTLKVVVATGMWDNIQDVIKRIYDCDTSVTDGDYTGGLTIGNECPMMNIVDGGNGDTFGATNPNTNLTSVLGLAEGTYPTVDQLLASPDGMALFDIIFFNCTSAADATLTNATYHTNLQAYVSAGGNFYSSDRSGDYTEQFWPTKVEWNGTTPGDGLLATPEPVNTAWDGGYGAQTVIVQDAGLLAWVQAQGWTSGAANNEFDVTFIGGEMIQQQVNTDVTTLIDATTVLDGITPIAGKTSIPISISFPSGSGCVFYTTFHSENDSTVPQERVLDYFIANRVNQCQ